MTLKLRKTYRSFGGSTEFYTHDAASTQCPMNFAVYRPPAASAGPVPVLYWLSGLTCSEENFMQKAGAQRALAAAGIMLVAMDTSPRGLGLPGEAERWSFGLGAGFYVNASQEPWRRNYRMFDYVSDELPGLIAQHFPVAAERQAIMGHSMGGHGALVIALRHAERYRSVSAFAPIAAPASSPWGRYAFSRYLGDDSTAWREYDASHLLRVAKLTLPALVDQGLEDEFLGEGQLQPEALQAAALAAGYPLELRYQAGYDHSYYFIASFVDEHIAFHRQHLFA